MNSDSWWRHAVVYEIDPKSFADGLKGTTQRLDYVQTIGIDAVLLDGIPSGTIDPALGTMDDLDDLVHQASTRNLRVLMNLDAKAADLPSIARLWLSHGVAGFYVPGATAAQLTDLRKVLNSFVGQRILVGDVDVNDPQQGRGGDVQLVADPRAGTAPQFSVATIRQGMEASQQVLQGGRVMPLLLSDGPSYSRSVSRYGEGSYGVELAKPLAAVLFASRAGTLLYFGQELGLGSQQTIHWDAPPKPKPGAAPAPAPPEDGPNAAVEDADPGSLLNWYRQLSALHHGNRTISSGEQIVLNHDDQNVLAWVRKPQSVSPQNPAVVVVCNLSAQPVTVSLKADMQKLRLRGELPSSSAAVGSRHGRDASGRHDAGAIHGLYRRASVLGLRSSKNRFRLGQSNSIAFVDAAEDRIPTAPESIFAGGDSHLGEPCAVSDEGCDCFGEFWIGPHEAGDAVADDVFGAAIGSDNCGNSTGEGFEDDVAESVGV